MLTGTVVAVEFVTRLLVECAFDVSSRECINLGLEGFIVIVQELPTGRSSITTTDSCSLRDL